VPKVDATISTPQWAPSTRERDDIELLTIGALAPLDRLLGSAELASVRADAALPDGTPWRADIGLTVSVPVGQAAQAAGSLDLTDPEGAPIARVAVDEVWPVEPMGCGVSGKVSALAGHEFGAFRRLFRTPEQVREEQGGRPHLAVAVVRPLGAADIRLVAETAEQRGATPLLLACVGERSPRGVSAAGLIRATAAAAGLIGADTRVVAVPLAARGDEAVDSWMRSRVASAFAEETLLLHEAGGELPEPVARIVEQDQPPRVRRGVTVFFTGLSGSGKSTLARALHDVLLEAGTRTVTLLDGDVVRRHLSAGLGFSREDRETNIRRIGFVAAEIGRHGGLAICSPIAPFDATRQEVRQMVEDAGGGFVLVHVATPLEECERRDRKGLYAKARAGEIPDFTGISSPYETPRDATVRVDTTGRSVDAVLSELLATLRGEGWLPEEEQE
jgi:sulfate adenylyltransferase